MSSFKTPIAIKTKSMFLSNRNKKLLRVFSRATTTQRNTVSKEVEKRDRRGQKCRHNVGIKQTFSDSE